MHTHTQARINKHKKEKCPDTIVLAPDEVIIKESPEDAFFLQNKDCGSFCGVYLYRVRTGWHGHGSGVAVDPGSVVEHYVVFTRNRCNKNSHHRMKWIQNLL